ncbi:ATP-binding protein [uncultured Aliivibrio sp.]|uniref:ATP-binding protein n=1 Tax=uncultured Aliivibrio sp. TaxID=873085 RepID=UPI0026138C03|nr:ATP-binding protein [uncultured Aliivibrio sp.]
MAQIIFNIVGNAVKCTKKCLICINIKQIYRRLTSMSVSDTGIRIGKNALNQLFLPFVQADSSITRQYGGLD